MAKLENLTIRMKRLVAVVGMTAAISITMWSQKPQTAFSDLKHRHSSNTHSRIMTPPVQSDDMSRIPGDQGFGRFTYDEDDVWSRTSFVNLGYVMDQTLKLGGSNYGYNAKWGASLQVGNSYMLPQDAFFGMVKVGIDATWFDFSGAQYDDTRYNHYHLTAGMGIGASVHVAPFVNLAEALGPLRVEGYCRFVPSYSLILKHTTDKFENEDGEIVSDEDIRSRGAFLPVVSCGFAVDYRAIGIGYEHRFGKATYKDLIDDGVDTKYDMTSDRIYISIRM